MTPDDFRRIALSFPNAQESSHMGSPDFRVDGRIFATLAHQAQGYGNLMLDPEQQQPFVAELPEIFLPVPGGWGRMGATHVRLTVVTEDVLTGALQTAYQLRLNKNAKSTKRPKSAASAARTPPTPKRKPAPKSFSSAKSKFAKSHPAKAKSPTSKSASRTAKTQKPQRKTR